MPGSSRMRSQLPPCAPVCQTLWTIRGQDLDPSPQVSPGNAEDPRTAPGASQAPSRTTPCSFASSSAAVFRSVTASFSLPRSSVMRSVRVKVTSRTSVSRTRTWPNHRGGAGSRRWPRRCPRGPSWRSRGGWRCARTCDSQGERVTDSSDPTPRFRVEHSAAARAVAPPPAMSALPRSWPWTGNASCPTAPRSSCVTTRSGNEPLPVAAVRLASAHSSSNATRPPSSMHGSARPP